MGTTRCVEWQQRQHCSVGKTNTDKWSDFNVETDPTRGDFKARILNATDPDPSAFQIRRGRLIAYHGTDDGLIDYQPKLNYLRSVLDHLVAANVNKFARPVCP